MLFIRLCKIKVMNQISLDLNIERKEARRGWRRPHLYHRGAVVVLPPSIASIGTWSARVDSRRCFQQPGRLEHSWVVVTVTLMAGDEAAARNTGNWLLHMI